MKCVVVLSRSQKCLAYLDYLVFLVEWFDAISFGKSNDPAFASILRLIELKFRIVSCCLVPGQNKKKHYQF